MYVLFLVIITFVIFNAGDVSTALSDIKGLFYGKELWNTETLYYLRSYGIVLAAAVVGATPLPKKLARRIGENARAAAVLQPVVLAVLLLICTAYLVDGSFNPFLYFRF